MNQGRSASKRYVEQSQSPERSHDYQHVDALTGCRICGYGPGYYLHKILRGPRGKGNSKKGLSVITNSPEAKIYHELKAMREQRHAQFEPKVIRRRKGF
jgi:hypothetical protein